MPFWLGIDCGGTFLKAALFDQSGRARGISAQGKGAFLLDRDRRPLGRAVLSSDQRALDIVRAWQRQGIPEQLYPKTLQTLYAATPEGTEALPAGVLGSEPALPMHGCR